MSESSGSRFGTVPLTTKHFLKDQWLKLQTGTKIENKSGDIEDARLVSNGGSKQNHRGYNNR